MKNLIFLFLLLSCFSTLLLGTFWNQFYPAHVSLKESISLHTIDGEEVLLGLGTIRDTVLFSGYRNCPTVCANALPILQKIASVHADRPLQVVFLDLTGDQNARESILRPEHFPNIKWVRMEETFAKHLLSKIHLERASADHHSSRVLLQRRGSDQFEIMENFSERLFLDWSEKSKKSLYSFSK
jgi:cytochrome oxidase Cu insertion factor (SCO1/SenC/PrrC family)